MGFELLFRSFAKREVRAVQSPPSRPAPPGATVGQGGGGKARSRASAPSAPSAKKRPRGFAAELPHCAHPNACKAKLLETTNGG
jgi:hypothetical protein